MVTGYQIHWLQDRKGQKQPELAAADSQYACSAEARTAQANRGPTLRLPSALPSFCSREWWGQAAAEKLPSGFPTPSARPAPARPTEPPRIAARPLPPTHCGPAPQGRP